MCNNLMEGIDEKSNDIWDYCFKCGKPLSEDMQENKDWFNIRNCGENFPICKECHDKTEKSC